MKIQYPIYLILLGLLLLGSCVSPQQYEALLQENEFLEEENNVLREEVKFTSDEHLLEGKLEADVTRLENELRQMQKRYDDLENTYLDLSSKYNLVTRDKGVTGGDVNCQAEIANMKRTLEDQTTKMRVAQLNLQQKEVKIKDLERLLYGQNFSN